MHQQKFLLVSILSNSTWHGCREIWKNAQNETTKHFSVVNTKVNILALTAGSKNKIRLSSENFVYKVSLDWFKFKYLCCQPKRA